MICGQIPKNYEQDIEKVILFPLPAVRGEGQGEGESTTPLPPALSSRQRGEREILIAGDQVSRTPPATLTQNYSWLISKLKSSYRTAMI